MDLSAEGQQCWRHLLCVVGFQNSERNKGTKRSRNNWTLTGFCVVIGLVGGGGLLTPSCSLYFTKPSLTYPSIIVKQGDCIHHSFLMLWTVSPWFERHAKDWNRATGVFYIEKDFLCSLLLFLLQQLPFCFMYGSCQPLCGPVTQILFLRIVLWSDAPKRKQLSPPTSEYGRILPTVNKTCSEID